MLGLFVLFPWAGQAADIYKWTDDSGVVHISETPPISATGGLQTIRTDDQKPENSEDAEQRQGQGALAEDEPR
jgi:hypothetical protein